MRGLQFFPVRVLRHSGSPVDGYASANILTLAPALDLERSDYTPLADGSGIRRLRRPVLRRAALEGHDIIRLAEYPIYLCVSERFARAFERGRCTGYGFHPLALS